MKAICLTCNKTEKFLWKIFPTVENQILTSSRLVVEPNRLAPGENYTFNVSLEDGKGFATVQMYTPKDVTESCTVLPLDGVETFTEFNVTCTGSELTFLYILFQGETQLLQSNNPVFTSKLNANEAVRVRIQDSYGQYLMVNVDVSIKVPSIMNSIDEINEIFTSKNASLDLKRMISDESQSNTLVFINMVAGRLNELKTVDVSETVAQILDLMNELGINHFDDVSPITDTLTKLLRPIQMNRKIAMKCAKILDKISIALQNYDDVVAVSDYISNTNRILSIINQIIDPFETIPLVQNANSLISSEYHMEDYKYYGELDFGIFEKLENLESITLSVDRTVNSLATCAAKLFQPMELLEDMVAKDIQFEVLAFDKEVALSHGNHLKINGTTVVVTVSKQLLSHFDSESSISCTFFNKNPMWWFSDENEINSDVVGVSIYKSDPEGQDNVSKIYVLYHLSAL